MNEENEDTPIEGMPAIVDCSVPDIAKVPEHVLQILCLLACNFSQASIARFKKVDPSYISNQVTRFDPHKEFRMTKAEQQKFLAKLFQARAGEALMFITPEKMESADAAKLMRIAATGMKLATDIDAKDEPDPKNPYDVLDSMGRTEQSPSD